MLRASSRRTRQNFPQAAQVLPRVTRRIARASHRVPIGRDRCEMRWSICVITTLLKQKSRTTVDWYIGVSSVAVIVATVVGISLAREQMFFG